MTQRQYNTESTVQTRRAAALRAVCLRAANAHGFQTMALIACWRSTKLLYPALKHAERERKRNSVLLTAARFTGGRAAMMQGGSSL